MCGMYAWCVCVCVICDICKLYVWCGCGVCVYLCDIYMVWAVNMWHLCGIYEASVVCIECMWSIFGGCAVRCMNHKHITYVFCVFPVHVLFCLV